MKPDRLSYIVAAHIFEATPGININSRPAAVRVRAVCSLIAGRAARLAAGMVR